MACGLALLASGQAFAGTYSSNGNIVDADLSSPNNWRDDGCGGSSVPTSISLTGAAADSIAICATHSLSLSTGVTLEATTLVIAGTWAGTGTGSGIKFSAGNKFIRNFSMGTLTITSLDLSLMALGDEIQFTGSNPVIFTSVAGGKSLSCTPSGGTAATYTAGNAIAAITSCIVAVAAVNNSVSAPIFSTKEKPAVFSEEVK